MDNQEISTDLFEPVDSLQISDPDALKLLADPFRSRILDLLRSDLQTAKELAQTLKLSPKKLYYHLKLMEEKGLIRIVSTRIVSGIIEKSYRATAYLFLFDGDVFRSSDPVASPLPPGYQSVFETTRTQLEASIGDGLVDLESREPVTRRLLWAWNLQRLSESQAQEFYARFEQLVDEFKLLDAAPKHDDDHNFRLFLTLFPVKAFLKSAKKKGD